MEDIKVLLDNSSTSSSQSRSIGHRDSDWKWLFAFLIWAGFAGIYGLIDDGRDGDAEFLAIFYRYIDDLITMNAFEFLDRVHKDIHPSVMVLNKAHIIINSGINGTCTILVILGLRPQLALRICPWANIFLSYFIALDQSNILVPGLFLRVKRFSSYTLGHNRKSPRPGGTFQLPGNALYDPLTQKVIEIATWDLF